MTHNDRSDSPFGQEIRTDLPPARPPEMPPAPPPPVRVPWPRRLLRGILIGLLVGAIIGAIQGAAFSLMATHVGNARVQIEQTTQGALLRVLDRTIVFALLGAVLVGLSQLLFGGWPKKDRGSRP